MKPKIVSNVNIFFLFVICLRGKTASGYNGRTDASFSQVDPSARAYCKESPDLVIDNAVLRTKLTDSFDMILHSVAKETLFLVIGVTSNPVNGHFAASASKAIPCKGQSALPDNIGAFIEKLGPSFYAVQKSNPMKLFEVTVDEINNRVDNKQVKWPLNLMKVFGVVKDPQSLRAAAAYGFNDSGKPQKYRIVTYDEKGKRTVVYVFNATLDMVSTETFPGADKVGALVPFKALDTTFCFAETMSNVSVGFLFDSFKGYFLPQEALGCPSAPCYADKVTDIMDLFGGKKRAYFGSWYFDFKAIGQKLDYFSAKRRKQSGNISIQFFGEYFLNSFLGNDNLTYILDNEKDVGIVRSNGFVDYFPKETSRFKVLPYKEGMWFRRSNTTSWLLHTSHLLTQAFNVETGVSGVKIPNNEFFGFNLWAKMDSKASIRAYNEDGGHLYVLLENMYYKFPVSSFKVMNKRFDNISETNRKRDCFVNLFGCPRVDPSGDLHRLQMYPCRDQLETGSGSTSSTEPGGEGSRKFSVSLIGILVLVGFMLFGASVFFVCRKMNKSKSGDSKTAKHPNKSGNKSTT